VPGVLLLERVQEAAERVMPGLGITGLAQVKFLAPLQTDLPAEATLTREPDRLRFRVEQSGRLLTQGVFVIAASPPPAQTPPPPLQTGTADTAMAGSTNTAKSIDAAGSADAGDLSQRRSVLFDRAAITALMPHQGRMCLLERVLEWDAQRITATSASHLDPAHPLRAAAGLRALHLCEYGAQAAALHDGLVTRPQGTKIPPGMLVAMRDVTLSRPFIHDLPRELRIEARLLFTDGGGSQHSFTVQHDNTVIATGRVAIITRAAQV
jgi:predicted hotdog family 3-hydroxylacyl-ACP dehydratase